MIAMNAEFRRNAWLELTPARMAVSLLAVASLLALAGTQQTAYDGLGTAAELIFAVVVFLWGGRLAAESVVQEIADRTWDGQRMSALGPWAMSWAKLFGAPICAWIASVPCLVVMVVYAPTPMAGLRLAATYVLLGILCHAVGLLLSLQSIRKGRQPGRMKTLFFQLLALAAIVPLARYLVWQDDPGLPSATRWFGLPFPTEFFVLITALAFAAWAVFGVYRQMRQELQKPTAPTAWLCFLAFLLVYQTGLIVGGFDSFAFLFDSVGMAPGDLHAPTAILMAAAALLGSMVYVAIFTEPKSIIGLRQAASAWRAGDYGRFWTHTPRWALTLALTAAAVAAVAALAEAPSFAAFAAPDIARYAIAMFLFLLRNVGIILLCNFAAGSGRGDMAAFIVLAVLSLAMPLIFLDAPTSVAALFWPPLAGSWAETIIPVAAQLVLVGGLLVQVWLRAEKQRKSVR